MEVCFRYLSLTIICNLDLLKATVSTLQLHQAMHRLVKKQQVAIVRHEFVR
ncbi:hypothetical protein Hanom_Chr16g01512691 [Helianthus anomalus]